MITLLRIIKGGFVNFVRNGVLSFASTTIMVLTLLSLSLFFIVNIALNAGIDAIQEKIDISAYLSDEANEEVVLELQSELASLSEVEAVKYVSKDTALERYKEQNANNQKLIDSLEGLDNPLPASIEVKLTNAEEIEGISFVFEKEEYEDIIGVDQEGEKKISYKENKIVIDKLVSATNFIERIGFVATAAFAAISLIIIFNTIRIAIFSQKTDIEVMQLVGATNWFIRGPFILEGIFYGVIATIISMVGLAAILYYSGPSITNYFGNAGSDITNYLYGNALLIFGVQLLIGTSIGTISSWLAMRKYLRV